MPDSVRHYRGFDIRSVDGKYEGSRYIVDDVKHCRECRARIHVPELAKLLRMINVYWDNDSDPWGIDSIDETTMIQLIVDNL